jgi:hypothetical protein
MMNSPEIDAKSSAPVRPVIPLPFALYVSNGLVFELSEGEQPDRRHTIRWERLAPVMNSPIATPARARRENNE